MELSRCPICGAEARFSTTEEIFNAVVKKIGSSSLEIECTNPDCGCCYWTHDHQHHTTDYETAKKVAAERWNHRAEVKESESL
jgi:uncharacterized protein with PIN domain